VRVRTFVLLAIAASGCLVTALAFGASFKCTTKTGVSYQDKPCADAPPTADAATASGKDADRPRDTQRVERAQKAGPERATERAVEKTARIVAVDPRRAGEVSDHNEWLERAARKSELLKRCAALQTKCSAGVLREGALYLSESQLEEALGAPIEKQTIGIAPTSYWKVRVTTENGFHNGRLTAAWGLCSDDKSYFASGHGQRACTVTVE